MSECAKCKVKKRDNLVGCEGSCQKWFHTTCVNLNEDEFKLLKKTKNLFFWCDLCKVNCVVSDKSKILSIDTTLNDLNANLLEINSNFNKEFLDSFLKNIKTELNSALANVIDDAKKVITTSIESKLNNFLKSNPIPPSQANATFASIVKNPIPPVILKPKNTSQSATITKSDILKKIDPVSSNIDLTRVQKVRNGGLLISCNNAAGSTKLKDLASSNLGDKYEIKQASALNPRVRVVGISSKFEDDVFLNYLKRQNKSCFSADHNCSLVSYTPHNIIECGKLFIGYDYCAVFDAIELRRCYNCCAFHHFANQCVKKDPSCPKCAGKHSVKDCQSTVTIRMYKDSI